jgi:hypothetical protein
LEKRREENQARKALLLRMEHHLKSGRKQFDDMKEGLESNDPRCDQMKNVMGAYERAFAAMVVCVGKGKNIENFDAEI